MTPARPCCPGAAGRAGTQAPVSAIGRLLRNIRRTAAHVRDVIACHYDGAFRQGKAGRPVAKRAARIGQTAGGWRAGPSRAMGEAMAKTL